MQTQVEQARLKQDEILQLQRLVAEKEVEIAASEARRTAQEAQEREKQRYVCISGYVHVGVEAGRQYCKHVCIHGVVHACMGMWI
jgi:hypothetical protein